MITGYHGNDKYPLVICLSLSATSMGGHMNIPSLGLGSKFGVVRPGACEVNE